MKGLFVKMYQSLGNGIWISKKRNSAGLSSSLFSKKVGMGGEVGEGSG